MLADRVRMGGRVPVSGWTIEALDGKHFEAGTIISDNTYAESIVSKPFEVPKNTRVYFSVEDRSFDMGEEPEEEIVSELIFYRNTDTVIIDGKEYRYQEDDEGNPVSFRAIDTNNDDTEYFLAGRLNGIYRDSDLNGYFEYEHSEPILLTSGDTWRLLFKGCYGRGEYPITKFYLKNITNNKTLASFTYTLSECYLTTCMVGYYGKDDNGIELNSMRKLREKYKIKHKDTLAEYYRVSPLIIKGIEQSGNKEYWYNEIKKVVDKIVVWVANKEWEKAEIAYLKLYYKLKNIFCSEVK